MKYWVIYSDLKPVLFVDVLKARDYAKLIVKNRLSTFARVDITSNNPLNLTIMDKESFYEKRDKSVLSRSMLTESVGSDKRS